MIRSRIGFWKARGLIDEAETRLLVADLLVAANRVANTAGTYGCFLRHWSQRAAQPLELRERKLRSEPCIKAITNVDASQILTSRRDLAYFDPPYTKRQYVAYYHVLETITLWDEPAVSGKTGLQPWKSLASDFCYESRALAALRKLVASSGAGRIILSYSDVGHVTVGDIRTVIGEFGRFESLNLESIGRHSSQRTSPGSRSLFNEYLFVIEPYTTQAEAVHLRCA